MDGVCGEAPAATTTFDPSRAVPDDDPDGRRAALEAMAETDPAAAFDLGMRLFRGDGFARDPHGAVTWMRRAGEGGDTRAAVALGRLYMTGLEETGPDIREARSWLSRAAAQGDREAATLLREAERLPVETERYVNPYAIERTGWWWRRAPYSYYWDDRRRWGRFVAY